ncbi:transcriptional regulator Spx [Oceanobacillus saliphilus]|uniref:transcriptional regulator Spx n=1 Tax=Oceanobacillus saliphilus TaxID=2925834 RepID=UPI00201E0A6B|nr:transcriptional regulator Spx [Oceanobacillus saliphilus]
MVTIFTSPGNASCRKAKKWFQENDIPFVERNIVDDPLTLREIIGILRMTDNGTEDIISTRSKLFQMNRNVINQLSLKDMISFIKNNPSIFKSPIIHDEKRLLVGYNGSQIRRFLPRSVRSLQLHEYQ